MDIEEKKAVILEKETLFAAAVARSVIDKPKVTYWLVLIPILFLHFIYRMKKYREGLTRFREDFLLSRKLSLNTAVEAVSSRQPPDIDGIAAQAGVSETIKAPYIAWMAVQAEHYMDLLSATGEDFASLVRSAFHDRTHYLLALNRLEKAERDFYSAIKPQLSATAGAAEIIAAIETHSRIYRRDLAQAIFS